MVKESREETIQGGRTMNSVIESNGTGMRNEPVTEDIHTNLTFFIISTILTMYPFEKKDPSVLHYWTLICARKQSLRRWYLRHTIFCAFLLIPRDVFLSLCLSSLSYK